MSAFAGTYADLKFVKSRKVAQVVIEMPIEDANRFLSAFGAPDPAAEVWCAIARLNNAPETDDTDEPEKPRRQWSELRPSARAAMLCNETAFQAFLKVDSADQAAEKIRRHCGIESRRELDSDETRRMMFSTIESKYEQWCKEHHF